MPIEYFGVKGERHLTGRDVYYFSNDRECVANSNRLMPGETLMRPQRARPGQVDTD
jgi:hypothetical protein